MERAQRQRVWRSEAARSLCEASGTGDPAAAIIAAAAQLVRESELDRPARRLKLLASLKDIRDIEDCPMVDSGRIIPVGDGFLVQVNEAHAPPRRNFSACHEVGHTLIPSFFTTAPQRRDDTLTGSYEPDEEEEYLCDLAASEILLPTSAIKVAAADLPLRFESLSALASDFEASLEATALKWVESCAVDMAILVWQMDWSPSEKDAMPEQHSPGTLSLAFPPKRLRLLYARCGGSMRSYFFPRYKSVGEDSLVYEAYRTRSRTYGAQSLLVSGGEKVFAVESHGLGLEPEGTGAARVISLVLPIT